MPDPSRKPQQKPAAAPPKAAIKGVFSTQEVRKVGTGTTTRKTVQKTFWYIEQDDNVINCQPLNINYVPSGPKRKITMDELITKFSPEPEFYMNSVFPKMQELQRDITNGDRCREKGENFSAEYEYKRALDIDIENVKANFGIGLTYLERGDKDKAENIFHRLVQMEATFEVEHKHLFNEFGISLRKNNMIQESREYYEKALTLTKDDENLHLNMARALLEMKDIPGCIEHLQKAMALNPRHEPSRLFLGWLLNKSMVPGHLVETVMKLLQKA
jgi:tetratricopeptide (TPR) repeat protein